MPKFFTRLGCAAAIASTFLAANAATDEAGNNFIYLAGLVNYPPTVEYADYWESAKVPETYSGSNIYETTVNLSNLVWGSVFRFYYDLAPSTDGCYNLNLIQPHATGEVSLVAGVNGVYSDEKIDRLPASLEVGTWRLPNDTYKFRVDLNKMTFQAIPKSTILMLYNDDSDPSAGDIASYVNIGQANYVEPCGNLELRLYDLYNNQWLNPADGYETLSPKDGQVDLRVSAASDTKGQPFVLENWLGGVVKTIYYYGVYRMSITPDAVSGYVYTPISPEQIYVIGDFNTWSEFVPVVKEAGDNAIYKVTLPAGTQYFKLILSDSWGSDEIGIGDRVTSDGTNKIYELRVKENGALANSEFPAALSEPVTFTVDLTEGTVSVPEDVDVSLAYVSYDGSVAPIDRDATLVVATPYDLLAPWKDCSDAFLSACSLLTKQPDGTYSGSVYVPEGKFKLHFVSELAEKGLPNTVIAPPTGADRELVLVEGVAYSSATEMSSDKAGYWTLADWQGGAVNISVTPGSAPSVKFDFSSSLAGDQVTEIYLVGTPQGWSITNDAMPLRLTSTGGYYGSYPINDAEPVFRFYTQLGDWGNDGQLPSVGSAAVDGNITPLSLLNSSTYYGSCVPGKGSWSIENWTAGETLYMYVNIDDRTVRFSTMPISGVGEFVDPDAKNVYIYQNGAYSKLQKSDDGFYHKPISSTPFRLFTKQLPISPEEAEWSGSYALAIPSVAQSELAFDEFDVAEFSVTENAAVTNGGGTEFTFPSSENSILEISVNPETGKVYVEKTGTAFYLCGGLTDGRLPTYQTRADFAGYRIPVNGGIVDIPAGKLDFSFVTSIADASLSSVVAEVSFTDGFAESYDPNDLNGEGWRRKNVVCQDWEGGKVMVCPSNMLDMSVVSEITAVTFKPGMETSSSTFAETSPGSLVFKGTASFFDGVDPCLYFNILSREIDSRQVNICVKSSTYYERSVFLGSLVNPDKNVLIPLNGSMTGEAAFYNEPSFGDTFSMPSLVGNGSMSVTLDLNDMTVTALVDVANEGSVYETVADEGSEFDGVTTYLNSDQQGAAEIYVNADQSSGYDFNFISPYGTVVQPAVGTDTPVTFDENGCWSGPFVKITAPSTLRRAIRKTAVQSARWHLDMPQSGTVQMLIDENTSTLTLYSEAHNRNYFIVPVVDGNIPDIGIKYLDEMKQNMLKETSPGIYTAEITIPDDAQTYSVFIVSDCGASTGLFTPVMFPTLDLSENEEASVAALRGESYYVSQWTITAPAGKVGLRYDATECMLYASRVNSGVEDVLAESHAELVIKAADGRIVVTAAEPAHIEIYTIAGSLVRSLDIHSGTYSIDIAPGFYIVNNQKLFVR